MGASSVSLFPAWPRQQQEKLMWVRKSSLIWTHQARLSPTCLWSSHQNWDTPGSSTTCCQGHQHKHTNSLRHMGMCAHTHSHAILFAVQKQLDWGAAADLVKEILRPCLDGESFRIKRNTFVAVRPFFYVTTACWRPRNCKLWNQVPKCNLLSSCVNWHAAKPVRAVTTLMLMLAQVNAFRNSHKQTLIKLSTVHPKQVKYDDKSIEATSGLHRIILEVKLWLNFFHLWLWLR